MRVSLHSRYGRDCFVLAERSASMVKIRPNVERLLLMKTPSCSVVAPCMAYGYVMALILLLFDGCLTIYVLFRDVYPGLPLLIVLFPANYVALYFDAMFSKLKLLFV